jgi:hypothetical protein
MACAEILLTEKIAKDSWSYEPEEEIQYYFLFYPPD